MAVKPVDTLSTSYSGFDDLVENGSADLEADAEVEVPESTEESADDEPVPPTEESDESQDSDDEESEIWEIAANGKTHKVDPKNVDEVKRLLSFGLGARTAFSNLAKARQELKRISGEVKQSSSFKEKAELFDKLESVKDDENELFRLITGGKSLDDVVEAKLKKQKEWESLDPVERIQKERDEREAQLIARIERMENKAKMEREQADKANSEAEDKKTYSTVYPEFQKVFKQLDIKDPVESQETAADLWALGWDRISRLAAQAKEANTDIDLTPEFVARQFAAVAKRWGYSVKEASKKEVSKILDKKSKDATKRAGLASTRNYSKSSKKNELDGLSPTKKFDRFFGNN